jgi:Protein of unknown function (DUF1573)
MVKNNDGTPDAQPRTSGGRAARNCAVQLTLKNRVAGWALALVPVAAAMVAASSPSALPPLAITADRPGLVFSEYLFDYGPRAVEPQPLLTPTIHFKNTTSREIDIGDMIASCGCVQPRVSAKTIAPGARERITIPIRTTGEQPGLREYTVTMAYTDTKPRETTLTVRVVLPEQQVVIEPRVLGIVGSSSRAIEHAVTVSDYRAKPLIVESATSSTSLIAAEIIKRSVGEEGSTATVAVQVAADTPPGIHRAILQFRTDDPEHNHLQLPVVLQGVPRPPDGSVSVHPAQIRMPGAEVSVAPVLLRINIPATWDVSHIDAFPPQLQTQFEDFDVSSGRREIRVKVSLTEVPSGRPTDGVITLVADEGQQMVSVPVSFVWPLSL